MSESQADQSKTPPDASSSRESVRLTPALALVIGALISGGLWFWQSRVRPHIVLSSGIEMLDESRLDEAIATFREAIRLRPTYFEAHVNLGIALDKKGDLDDAVAVLREAIRLNPGDAPAHSALGNALSHLGRVDEAIGAYRKEIQLSRGSASASASHELGKYLSRHGKFEEAIAAFKDAIHGQISTESVYYDLSHAQHALKNASKASTEYRDAVRTRPTEVAVQKNLLGNALRYREKLNEAIVEFREAIRLRPDFAECHLNLARTLFRQGKPREAVAEFREAIRLDPADASARKELRDALIDLGEGDGLIAK
jgi:tetratricopeptide (TPR) repeat protein